MLPTAHVTTGEPLAPCLLMMLNGAEEPQKFLLPGDKEVRWRCIFDSVYEGGDPGDDVVLTGRSRHEVLDNGFTVWEQCGGTRAGAQCGMPAPRSTAPPAAAVAGRQAGGSEDADFTKTSRAASAPKPPTPPPAPPGKQNPYNPRT